MASLSERSSAIDNLTSRFYDGEDESRPAPPQYAGILDTDRIGGGPHLRFKYAALKNDLRLIDYNELKQTTYLARGVCSHVIKATLEGTIVAVKQIVSPQVMPAEGPREHNILVGIHQLRNDVDVCAKTRLSQARAVPALLGYGSVNELPFLVMEYADAGNLRRFLYVERDWSLRLNIIEDVASALVVLHENDIQHGDLKLENILVFSRPDGGFQVKLCDFSHSRYLPTMNRFGRYAGTWPFRPTEVWLNHSESDLEKCDIWTFGMVLWRTCQYQEDVSTKLLDFIPQIGDDNDSTPRDTLLSTWRDVSESFVEVLRHSSLVGKDADALTIIFSSCLHLEPALRPSAHVIQRQLNRVVEGHGRKLTMEKDGLADRLQGFELSVEEDNNGRDGSNTPDEDHKDRNTSLPHLKVLKLLRDRSSWNTQVDFYNKLLIAQSEDLDIDPLRMSPISAALMACRTVGYGCDRDTSIISGQQLTVPRNDAELRTSSDPDPPEGTRSEIPALRFLDLVAVELLDPDSSAALSVDVLNATSLVLELLMQSPDPIHPYSMVWSALQKGFPYAALLLIRAGANVDHIEPRYGTSTLHMLWRVPDDLIIEIGTLLLEKGASINVIAVEQHAQLDQLSTRFKMPHTDLPIHGGTPLLWSVAAGNQRAVSFLIQHGADPLEGRYSSKSPLNCAVSLYRHEMIPILIKSEQLGTSFITSTARQEILLGLGPAMTHVIQRFSLYGAHSQRDAAERTVEQIIQMWPKPERVQLLEMILSFSVIKRQMGEATVLDVDFITIILSQIWQLTGAPLPAMRSMDFLNGISGYWRSDRRQCEKLLSTVLEEYGHMFDLSVSGDDGRTVLHTAAIMDAVTLIPIFVHHGAPIDALDVDGITPAGVAARMASAGSLEYLLDAGASAFGRNGSILHYAAIPQTHVCLVRWMLYSSRHRDRLRAVEVLEAVHWQFRTTALGICVLGGHLDAVRALLSAGANGRAAVGVFPQVVLSVREIAVRVRYRPHLTWSVPTMQREALVDKEKLVADCQLLPSLFYSTCDEFGCGEGRTLIFDSGKPRGRQIILSLEAREPRAGEPFADKTYVSLDVLGHTANNPGLPPSLCERDWFAEEKVTRIHLTL